MIWEGMRGEPRICRSAERGHLCNGDLAVERSARMLDRSIEGLPGLADDMLIVPEAWTGPLGISLDDGAPPRILGLAATIILTVYIARRANQALTQRLPHKGEDHWGPHAHKNRPSSTSTPSEPS